MLVETRAQDHMPGDTPNIVESIETAATSAAVKLSEQEEDLLRKTGDSTLYKYYMKSVGWKDGITILLLTIGAQFCVYFPRESTQSHHSIPFVFRVLANRLKSSGSSCGRKQTLLILEIELPCFLECMSCLVSWGCSFYTGPYSQYSLLYCPRSHSSTLVTFDLVTLSSS